MTAISASDLRWAQRVMRAAFGMSAALLFGGLVVAGPSGYSAPGLELAMLEYGIASMGIGLFIWNRLQPEPPPPRKIRQLPANRELPAAVSYQEAA